MPTDAFETRRGPRLRWGWEGAVRSVTAGVGKRGCRRPFELSRARRMGRIRAAFLYDNGRRRNIPLVYRIVIELTWVFSVPA